MIWQFCKVCTELLGGPDNMEQKTVMLVPPSLADTHKILYVNSNQNGSSPSTSIMQKCATMYVGGIDTYVILQHTCTRVSSWHSFIIYVHTVCMYMYHYVYMYILTYVRIYKCEDTFATPGQAHSLLSVQGDSFEGHLHEHWHVGALSILQVIERATQQLLERVHWTHTHTHTLL